MTGGGMLTGIFSVALALTTANAEVSQQPPQEQTATPRFRASVEMVSVAAVVRDRKGRFVTDLSKKDFEVVEAGQRRDIVDFRAELNGPVKVAVLVDVSGSMRMAQRTAEARQAADHIFANLTGKDEAAVFSFDTMLSEVQTFTSDRSKLQTAVGKVEKPYGQTSLYDAIAATARMVAEASKSGPRGLPQRSAVVVITDGVDTRSRMAPAEVAAAASEIDVPVYILAVVSSVDDPRETRRRPASGCGVESSGPCARNRRGLVHLQRSGARERRGPPDHRRTASSVRACFRSIIARRLAATSDSRPQGHPDGAGAQWLRRRRASIEFREQRRVNGTQRTSHRPVAPDGS